MQGQVGSCQSTCQSGGASDFSHHVAHRHRSSSQLCGVYSQNDHLTAAARKAPRHHPPAPMLDGLRGTIRALCLEDLMRHPRHSRSQVHSCLKETLDMEAANAQCSVTELSSLLAFDLHCGIPGKVRRVVFNDDHTAALDHAFLYVHLGIHLFCLSTRVQGVIQALQRLQLIDADVLSGVGKPLGGYAGPPLVPLKPPDTFLHHHSTGGLLCGGSSRAV